MAVLVAGAVATETAIKMAKISRAKVMRNYPAIGADRQSPKPTLT
jgi:hypothetical protein